MEAELSIAVSVMIPTAHLTAALAAFLAQFPSVALRLYVEALGGVVARVLDGTCRIGVTGTIPSTRLPDVLVCEPAGHVEQLAVTSPAHPLAMRSAPATGDVLREHVQLVLTDRSTLTAGQEVGIAAPETWRVADLSVKHAMLLAGLGWGSLPRHMVEDELAAGRLVLLSTSDVGGTSYGVPLVAIYRRDEPPGPAGRALLGRLKLLDE